MVWWIKGLGSPIDYNQAAIYFERSAIKGEARGAYRLALLYHEGKLVPTSSLHPTFAAPTSTTTISTLHHNNMSYHPILMNYWLVRGHEGGEKDALNKGIKCESCSCTNPVVPFPPSLPPSSLSSSSSSSSWASDDTNMISYEEYMRYRRSIARLTSSSHVLNEAEVLCLLYQLMTKLISSPQINIHPSSVMISASMLSSISLASLPFPYDLIILIMSYFTDEVTHSFPHPPILTYFDISSDNLLMS
jgi:hypothetical protein